LNTSGGILPNLASAFRSSPANAVAYTQILAAILFFGLLVHSASAATPSPQKHSQKKSAARVGRVQTGLDVLEAGKFSALRGKHIGIITNHTGLDSQGKSTIDLLAHAPQVTVVAIFSPEHGLAGRLDESVSSSKDAPPAWFTACWRQSPPHRSKLG
jgi:uncharacterized protein YbbC (DUF1343 family)